MLKPKEVMEILRISRPTFYRWIEKGQLPAIKIGNSYRFRESDIEKLLEKNRTSQ